MPERPTLPARHSVPAFAPDVRIERLTGPDAATVVGPLLRGYVTWVVDRLSVDLGVRVDDPADVVQDHHEVFLANLPHFLGTRGRLLVARRGDEVVGACGLLPVDLVTAEVKRMYVRPDARGYGIGRALIERLLADARAEGYRAVRLETLSFMSEAQALYRSVGFRHVALYDGSEVERLGVDSFTRYMEVQVAAPVRAARRERRPRRAALGALALAGLVPLLVGCGDGDDSSTAAQAAAGDDGGAGLGGSAADAQEVAVTIPGGDAGEFAFEADLAGLTAGPVTVSVTNEGALEHQAMLLRLDEGEDVASFAAAAAADPSGVEALGLVEGFGGPNGVAPGETLSSTQVLEEGDYMLICVLPDGGGVPHVAHGMVTPFSVGPAEPGTSVEPLVGDPADADVTLVDFGFSVNGSYEAGDTVTVANDGEQDHELAVYRLGDGVTADEARAAFADPTAGGAAPVTAAGGIGAVAVGEAVEFTLPDEPGDYLFVCFIPDVAGDARPHHAHGMVAEVTLS